MGKVYLVGAGPGDPELITWKGRRVLAQADSILYDNLVNHALLDLAPEHAEKFYVGKKKSSHSFSQEEICRMLRPVRLLYARSAPGPFCEYSLCISVIG